MDRYLKLLLDVHSHPRSFQSDFARYNAYLIAEAASRGHITSVINGLPVGRWHVTTEGLQFLKINEIEV